MLTQLTLTSMEDKLRILGGIGSCDHHLFTYKFNVTKKMGREIQMILLPKYPTVEIGKGVMQEKRIFIH